MAESTALTPAVPLIAPGFGNFRFDAFAGFLVFLIAMPLCLAIAKASGFPAIAGIWTAVIGGIVTSFISNAQLTIKGPAAGLIVIVLGAVTELGAEFATPEMTDFDKARLGYELALGIGLTAGVIQVLFGLLRVGRLADFFPLTPVHGMLASIGIIIIAKQAYEVLGIKPEKGVGPLELLWQLPTKLDEVNPVVALIGVVGLVLLFSMPYVARRVKFLKKVPSQLIVLVVAIGLAFAFDLQHEHGYTLSHYTPEYHVGPKSLVDVPNVLEDPASAFTLPSFRGLSSATGWQYLLLFTLIGSLESLLSAKAVELLDPWKRKTNFDRDLLAVGLANTLASAVGGLPMISEIVRSKANIDNGARTRMSNAVHGLCLLGFVLFCPGLMRCIPLAALGAMLVYTGCRLASPSEFLRTYKVGTEQFVVFISTIIATLATDLLIGIAVGIALKVFFHLWNGCSMSSFWKSDVELQMETVDAVTLKVRKSVIFANWIGLRNKILPASENRQEITLDLSETKLIDHSVMEKLHELEADFTLIGKQLHVFGLEQHKAFSSHPLSARKRSMV